MGKYAAANANCPGEAPGYERIAFWFMVFVALVGLLFRLKGLGHWPFTNDEYYIAASVHNILQRGWPEFDCGGFYVRGLLYQYLMVPVAWAGFDSEFAYRLVPVVSYLIAIPALYQLAKRMGGSTVAALVVAVFAISTLEIEISRFARMYMPFQALFLWYLYYLYRVVVEGDVRVRPRLYLLTVLSPLVWEGGIFLALLNLLPVVDRMDRMDRSERWHAVISVVLLVAVYTFLSFDFRYYPLGVAANWPPGLIQEIQQGGGKLYHPMLLASTLTKHTAWFALAVVPLILGIWGTVRTRELTPTARMAAVFLVLLAFGNAFSLLALAGLVFALLGWWRGREWSTSAGRLIAAAIIVSLIYWLAYAFGTEAWRSLVDLKALDALVVNALRHVSSWSPVAAEGASVALVLSLFPNGLVQLLYAWISTYPILITLYIVAIVGGLAGLLGKDAPEARGFRFVAAVLLICIMAVAMLTIGKSTRYTFFLFPLMLLLALTGLQVLAHRFRADQMRADAIVVVAFVGLVSVSDDIDFGHLLHIDTPEVNFRTLYANDPRKLSSFIMRRDYRGVAELIERKAQPGDIVISTLQTVAWYTQRIDYIFFGPEHEQFKAYTACAGTRSLWTNLPLIYDAAAAYQMIDHADATVWIILNLQKPRPDEAKLVQRYGEHVEFRAQDGVLAVLRVEPGDLTRNLPLPQAHAGPTDTHLHDAQAFTRASHPLGNTLVRGVDGCILGADS